MKALDDNITHAPALDERMGLSGVLSENCPTCRKQPEEFHKTGVMNFMQISRSLRLFLSIGRGIGKPFVNTVEDMPICFY
ncbi:MAG: hypothetical protein WAX69_04275 [Victivallales bacterium]